MAGGPDGEAGRIQAIDTARLLGLLLMYYGHVAERVMYLGNASAGAHYKFVYSFHMPLFFALAGMVGRDTGARETLGSFLRTRLASRVVPLLFFNALLAALSLFHSPDFPPFPLVTARDYAVAAISSVTVLTVFDVPTWFLLCIVCVEVLHFALFRFLRGSAALIGAAAVAFYAGGYALNLRWDFFSAHRNIWLWNEAVTMYGFYLLGVLLARWDAARIRASRPVLALLALAAFALVALTYDLNQGPFRLIQAVVILAAGHGHPLWFPLTAVAGSLGVLLVARLVPTWPVVRYLGRNGLLLLGLNGVFYHHINGPLAAWFARTFPQGPWSVFAFAGVATLLSAAAAIPAVWALDRLVPQLVGRPRARGPLLPALVSAPPTAGP